MSDYQPINDVSVDRREETVVTQQPGYAATERVTRDVAAERRFNWNQFNRIVWIVLSAMEIVLGLRFVLKLIGANPNSGFGSFVYGLSGPLTAPFNGLIANLATGNTVFEVTTLIAMAVYALFFQLVMRVVPIFFERSSARSVTRTTREQTPGGQGNVRTTSSVSKD